MTKYIAFLRGIAPMNPNMRNEKLRGVMEDLGFTNVRTVISSGNILFESSKESATELEAIIEPVWSQKLGFTSTTIVRSLDDLKRLAEHNPFAGYEHSPRTSLNVTFLKNHPAKDVHFEGRDFTLVSSSPSELCAVIDTTTDKTSDYMSKAEKTYGKKVSTRSWKTIERILSAFEK